MFIIGSLAYAYAGIKDTYYYNKQYKKLEVYLEKSIELNKKMVEISPEGYTSILAKSYFFSGFEYWMYGGSEKFNKSKDYINKSEELYKKVQKTNPVYKCYLWACHICKLLQTINLLEIIVLVIMLFTSIFFTFYSPARRNITFKNIHTVILLIQFLLIAAKGIPDIENKKIIKIAICVVGLIMLLVCKYILSTILIIIYSIFLDVAVCLFVLVYYNRRKGK